MASKPAPAVRGQATKQHMLFMHGVWVNDLKTPKQLREAHEEEHSSQWSHARIPHSHEDLPDGPV